MSNSKDRTKDTNTEKIVVTLPSNMLEFFDTHSGGHVTGHLLAGDQLSMSTNSSNIAGAAIGRTDDPMCELRGHKRNDIELQLVVAKPVAA